MVMNRAQSRSFLIACGVIVTILVQAACVVRFNQPTFKIPSSQIDTPINMKTAIAQTVVAVENPQSGADGPIGPVNQETAIHQTVVAVEGPQESTDGNPNFSGNSADDSSDSSAGSSNQNPTSNPGVAETQVPPSIPAVATTQVPPSNPAVATTRAPENNSAIPTNPVVSPPNNNQSNQNSNVTVFNHSSRPIVSLVIDGAEQILTESNSVLSGGSVGLFVPDGSHSLIAHNGWWEGGYRKTLYNWSVSFTKQDNPIDIYDHPITLLLPKYQSSGYLAGEFWEGTDYHYAGFCFSNSSTFTFYVDGQYNDSGNYTEVSRNSSGFSVTFNISNAAGESINGTYNELDDSFNMQNGPPDWPIIQYIRSGGCP